MTVAPNNVDEIETTVDVLKFGLPSTGAANDAIRERHESNLVHGTSLSPSIITGLVAISDATIVIVSALIVFVLRDIWYSESLPIYFAAIVLNTVIVIATFRYAGLYEFNSMIRRRRQFRKIFVSCATAFLLIAALAFAFKVSETFSRVWAFSWFGIMTVSIMMSRSFYSFLLRNAARVGTLSRNVAVVGAGSQGARLVESLLSRADSWTRVVGVFDDRIGRVPGDLSGVPIVGDLDFLVSEVRRRRIDEVYVALPWHAEARLEAIVKKVAELPVEIHITSDLVGFAFPNATFSLVSGLPSLNVARKPFADWKLVLKQIEDYFLATSLTIFLGPLMLLIAAAIKLDSPGPVLFRQKRFGYNNQTIEVFKFRTMYHERGDELGGPQAARNDPRVTRIGKYLRCASLDELPQLFNVLNGTMSLIGPRPHAVAHNEQFAPLVESYFARHRVKPGLTGWAQVNGLRGETDTTEKMAARVKADLYYIENWSMLLDLRILLETFGVVFRQVNAY